MKRTVAILLTVLAVMLLIPAIALAADKKPVSIEYVDLGDLKKDTYAVGEKFNPAGLKFTVTYDDSSTETIKYSAAGLKFRTTPFEIGDVGTGVDVNYTFTKNGVSVSCDSSKTIKVDVYKLDSISITFLPGKDYYMVGEKFNPNLMVVTAHYDPSSVMGDKVIVNNYKYTPTTAFTEDDALKGTVDINVSYSEGGITVYDTASVTVKVNKPVSLDIEAQPKKTVYAVGQKLDPAGMVVVATFDDGSKKTVTPSYDKNYTFTEEDAIKGTKDFLLSYTSGGITVTATLTVEIMELDKIEITQKPHKLNYHCGETLDLTGMIVTATYSNGKTKVIKDYTVSQVGPFTIADFDYTYKDIVISYSENGVVCTDAFTVNLVYPKKVKIIAPPEKTTYNVGESFDPTGMIVSVEYSDGSEHETNAYTFSSKPFEEGDDHITIYYADPGNTRDIRSTDLDITVTKTAAMSIHMSTGSLNMVAGDTYVLTATVYPTDADYDPIKWEVVTGTGIIDVDQNGQVYAVAPGNAIVKASVDCGGTTRYAYCYVCVIPKVNLTSLKFKSSALELLLGDSTTLTPVVSPANATVTSMVWKTSNSSIVSVTDSGKIKGLQVGTATISVTTGGKVATCQVTVVSALSRWGIVYNCKSRVNVREKPSGTSKSVGYAPYGCKYKIVGESGGWYQIQFGTEKAWIWKNYLKPISESEKTYVAEETSTTTPSVPTTTTGGLATATKVTIINCTRYVYIRKGPGTTYGKMGHATLGSTYSLKGARGDWYVVDVNGETGYIYKMVGSVS